MEIRVSATARLVGMDLVIVVRKVVLEGHRVVRKYGLSQETGEWIRVLEGARYPDECLLKVGRVGMVEIEGVGDG